MSDTGAGGGARIMLVEDELLVGMDLAQALEEWGYEVLGPYGSPGDALNALSPHAPDLGLLDVNLGAAGDSRPVAEGLAQAGRPFLFLTGYDCAEAPLGSHLRAPCVAKPVNLPALREAVAQALQDARCR
jgi:CheY-like chemotaxis protein